MSRTARFLTLAALSLPLGCPLFGGHSTTPAGGHGAGAVRNYTDSDVISGVAVTGDRVFVGTARGVLRYPLAGGAPTRMTTQDGLPDNQIFAISASPEGEVWAATPHGVVRYLGDRWATAGEGQPNVGRVTAVLALSGGGALLGGAQGIARFDGTQWTMMSNQYQVTAFGLDQGQPLVATAQSGILAIRGDFTSLDEYGTASGIPETLVRSFAPVGNGRFWALVQGTEGSKLAYYDGTRWYGYTHEHVRSPWLAVVPFHDGAALVVDGALYEIRERHGDGLAPTDLGNPGGVHRVELHPEPFAAPPPPPPPVASPAPPPRGRGRGRPAPGRGHKEIDVERGAQRPAGHHAASPAHASASPAPAASASPSPAPTASAAPAHAPPPPPRNIPAYAGPVEVPHGGPTLDAPSYGLEQPRGLALTDDVAAAYGMHDALYVWRIGLGVSRLDGGGGPMDYRSHDLAMQHRPLSLATDNNNNVWLVTEDGGSARYDGRRFQRVQLDPDPSVVPLMFWARGTTIAAAARVGPNVVRAYRFQTNHWQSMFERPIETGGPGIVDVKFLSVDERGRFWLGIRVVDGANTREYGVAVLDEQPAATQFNSHTPPTGAVQGAAPAPDDLTAVEFASDGTAWFAGLSGATSIALATEPGGTATVHTYSETNGLHGDLVSDLAKGPNDRIYLATPEGLGYWDGQHFNWDIVGSTAAARAIALAVDTNGQLWGAGPRGAWAFDGQHFRAVGRGDGLPTEAFDDIAVDGENRIWFVTGDGISILSQHHETGESASGAAASGGE